MTDAINQSPDIALTLAGLSSGGLSELTAELEKQSGDPPSTIFHYTNDHGLRGILKTGKLWLTSVFDLNDPAEVLFGLSGGVDLLREQHPDIPPRLISQVLNELNRVLGLFCCSFSTSAIDIGQWRAYADDGKGFILEFDRKGLESSLFRGVHPTSSLWCFNVNYDETKNAEIQKLAIGLAVKDALEICKPRELASLTASEKHAFFGNIVVAMIMGALRFKHPAYRSEAEYRALYVSGTDEPRPQFREGPYSLRKYRELNWNIEGNNCLRKIYIGPAADKNRSKRMIESCFEAYGISGVELQNSVVPYRPRP